MAQKSFYVTENKVLSFLKISGFDDVDLYWSQEFKKQADRYLQQGLDLAKEYHVKEIPVAIVSGPRGSFKVNLDENLKPDQLASCLEEVLKLQKQPLFLKYSPNPS
jgi:hypothetical protein